MTESGVIEEASPGFTQMSLRQLVKVALIGAVTGLVTWGLAVLLETYVFKALCQATATAQCSSPAAYAGAMAAILAAAGGLFALVKIGVFRPLLIVLAATLSMWGLLAVVTALLPGYGVALSMAGMYALSYVTFTWLVRVRQFWVAALLVLLTVIAVRLILMR